MPGVRGACAGVGIVVLAAGASRRAGARNKLLHPIRSRDDVSRPMVRQTVERALSSALGDVVVVTGHDADAVGAALDTLPVRQVHNEAAASGVASSLLAGIEALLDEQTALEAVIVCLADMPLVRADTLVALHDAWRQSPDVAAVVPVHAGRRGNPVLLDRSVLPALRSLQGDTGARAVLRGNTDVRELGVDDPGVLIDHDTAADLARLSRC